MFESLRNISDRWIHSKFLKEQEPSDMNEDKKSALKRRIDLRSYIQAQDPTTVGSRRTCTVFKVQGSLATVMGIMIILAKHLARRASA